MPEDAGTGWFRWEFRSPSQPVAGATEVRVPRHALVDVEADVGILAVYRGFQSQFR